MNALDFVERLTANLRSRKTEAAMTAQNEYRDILEAINRGETIEDFARVEALLLELGKDPSEIATDAQNLAERIAHRTVFDTLDGHRANLAKFQRQVDSLVAERNEYLSKMAGKINAAQEGLRTAEHGFLSAEAARGRLLETCDDVTIKSRQAELEAERRDFTPAFREAEQILHDITVKVSHWQRVVDAIKSQLVSTNDASRITELLDGPQARQLRKRLSDAEDSLEKLREPQRIAAAKFAELRKRVDVWNRETQKLEERKLKP